MSSEYVTDVSYVRRVDNDLGPARLRVVAALNGFPPPPKEAFTYCEVGCGYGDTTLTLAAANPSSRFVGVDINPEHVATGTRIAKEGGLSNIEFIERDFETLEKEIPDLDYLCAHGVLSWIGPAKRAAMFAFAKRKLKPGGLFYVSYNTMPGWAAIEPLRQLLVSPTAGIEADSLERARRGLAFAKEMNQAGAEYFRMNPAAKEMLVTMEREGLSYIVHEYLNPYWVPMYFAQVAFELAQSDLHFVGGLPLHTNYRDLALPTAVTKLFEKMTDRLTFESLKDFALNEFFRRDIYVKGRPGRDPKHTNEYFDATPFGMMTNTVPAEREVRLPHQTIRYDKPIFDALFPALQGGAKSAVALATLPELASFGIDKVRVALIRMVLGGHAVPFLQPTEGKARPPKSQVASAFNRLALGRASTTGYVLASPITGAGISLPAHQAIALRALTEVAKPAREKWLRDLCTRGALKLEVKGRAIEGVDAQIAFFHSEIATFENIGLAKLTELGVLETHSIG